jgi:hypothetical protein
VLFLPRSTSLARATPVKAVAKAAPGKSTAHVRVAQTPNARSGAHVATSRATHKAKTVVAHKAGGSAARPVAKTRVAQP